LPSSLEEESELLFHWLVVVLEKGRAFWDNLVVELTTLLPFSVTSYSKLL